MVLGISVVFVGLVLALLYVAAQRAVTIAELAIDAGSVRVVRGGLAAAVLADLGDVASRPPRIRAARVTVTRTNGRAEVRVRGELHPEKVQQLRNVIGSVPLAKLTNARRRR